MGKHKPGRFITREDVVGVWLIYVTAEGKELPLTPFAKGTPTAHILQQDLREPAALDKAVDRALEALR